MKFDIFDIMLRFYFISPIWCDEQTLSYKIAICNRGQNYGVQASIYCRLSICKAITGHYLV